MSSFSTTLLKTGLSALYYSGAARLLAPIARGEGAIFMLHHVSPESQGAFAPNRLLTITPQFLDKVITEVKAAGLEIVTLDEAHARMSGGRPSSRPFACFTFDDGYRDNRDYALPVLRRHNVPCTIYVASDFADGNGFLWWLMLERVIAASERISIAAGETTMDLACATTAEKWAAFNRIYWVLRTMPEAEARALVAELAAARGLDIHEPCRDLVMSWDELRELAADPLVTIGAHSVTHMALAKLPTHRMQWEISSSVARIERELGLPVRHFCYPYGSACSAGEREFEMAAQLGLATAVTTRKGYVSSGAGSRMTGLARISLNGEYQEMRYLKALLSGVPFRLWEGWHGAVSAARAAVAFSYSMVGGSGRCIQRTSNPAGQTQASPPTT